MLRVSGEGGAQDPCPLPRVVPVHARGSETSQGVNDEICAARQAPGAETGLGSARLSGEALREGSWAHRDCRTPAWGGGSLAVQSQAWDRDSARKPLPPSSKATLR